ncbi:MAG: hypothetical protein WC325_02590 [Candidatus Bathyarchaeia archaeon]|jgi:uncharacterized protein (TIGR00290 family)
MSFSHEGLFLRVAVTWTGGKDCCLACYEAIKNGHDVSYLLNFVFTDIEKRTQYKMSNLIKFVFTDIGRSTPFKVATLLNFVLSEILNKFPRRISKIMNTGFMMIRKLIPNKIANVLNYAFKSAKKMVWHEISPEMVALQGQAMDIPMLQPKVNWRTFEEQIKITVHNLDKKVGGMVWGIAPPGDPQLESSKKLEDYIQLRAEKEWVEQVCEDLDIEPMLPLWDKAPEQVLTDLIDNGFEVVVVVVNQEFLGDEYLGRRIDREFLKEIMKLRREKGIHVSGDEYHTFVVDGPIFKKRLNILESNVVSKNGYSILNITKAELQNKNNA